ncbi:TetR/AcrR family transcriptional regulator [Georgenia subflava]|uniref:TetR family transcriptional regulator n=1 Tax=Georgenia subflava TaxID=1622177 RepID=A0A6N7EQ10_9MICO|nr:TetR/AcrR family transcriptional regulator [Georgenia subflava]MPV38595.1 TetR family transcriptional regulator [Georgenia subflava]
MTKRRDRALDAAVELVGTEGIRALTHARVDERAGLPKGSTSNYFRTRQALVAGVVDRVLERERPQIGATFSPPATADEFVERLAGILDFISRDRRTETTARLVLFMEASHDAELREVLSRGRATLEATLVLALANLGARDPAAATAALAACLEGLLLHRIGRHDYSDPRPVLDLVVRGALR